VRLTDAIGHPELRDDSRFADNADRMAHLPELRALLETVFRARGTAEWLAVLGAAGVPAGPVASVGEMLAHPQTLAREMVVEVKHSSLGTMRSLGSPVKLSGSADATGASGAGAAAVGPDGMTAGEPRPRVGAPRLGEHTREVLAEAGWTDAEVDALVATGVALEPA
jgi:crotonobetainyl-CoA:carnitine CoA-transferase CaiB-like acyl-CoA transferase